MSYPRLLLGFRWDARRGQSWLALREARLWQGGSQSDSAKAIAPHLWTFLGEHPIVLQIVVGALIAALVTLLVVAYKRGITIWSLRIGPPAKQPKATKEPISQPSKSEDTDQGHALLRLKLSELDQRL